MIRILLITLCLTGLLGPSVYRSGVLAHFATHRAAIIAAHCENKLRPELHCDGQCHLRKQLVEPRKEDPVLPTLPSNLKDFQLSTTDVPPSGFAMPVMGIPNVLSSVPWSAGQTGVAHSSRLLKPPGVQV